MLTKGTKFFIYLKMACLVNVLYNSLFGPRYYPLLHIHQNAKPGDLIAFNRGTYRHYAIYVENGKVINVGAEDMDSESALISEMSLEKVAGDSYARIENHDDFASNFFGKRPGYAWQIIQRARKHLGQRLPYEFSFRNCEYYCTLWRFGVGFSTQVVEAKPMSGMNRYNKFIEHRATCDCDHDYICRCTIEHLSGEMQILDLLVP